MNFVVMLNGHACLDIWHHRSVKCLMTILCNLRAKTNKQPVNHNGRGGRQAAHGQIKMCLFCQESGGIRH